jgi:hypothetical protein
MSVLPKRAIRFLRSYHADGVKEEDCRACSSPCCSHGGFAILENVVQIYEQYRAGALRRPDFDFHPDLDFKGFVFRYFDVYQKAVQLGDHESVILLFHMRSLSTGGHPIQIPAVGGSSYWETRVALFEANPWLNRGCVFLSHGVGNWPEDDGDSTRHCLLHSAPSGSHVTAKPIDCVFYTCDRPIAARAPTQEQSTEWFEILAESFPNSVERFEDMIGREPNRTAGET